MLAPIYAEHMFNEKIQNCPLYVKATRRERFAKRMPPMTFSEEVIIA
jgi:hypothetical protein